MKRQPPVVFLALTVAIVLLFLPSWVADFGSNGALPGLTEVNATLSIAATSSSFYQALIVGAAISVPICFEILLSTWARTSLTTLLQKHHVVAPQRAADSTAPSPSFPSPATATTLDDVYALRWLPVVIFSLPYMLMVNCSIPGLYVMATLFSQRMAGIVFVLVSLRCDELGVWTDTVTRNVALVMIAHDVLAFYADVAIVGDLDVVVPLYVVSSIVAAIGGLMFAVACRRWWRLLPAGGDGRWRNMTANQGFCLGFMLLATYHRLSVFLVRGVAMRY